MQISEIMNHQLSYIDHSSSLRHAAEIMRDDDVGMIPIMDENQIIGTLTDRDITVRAVAGGIDPETPVRQFMSHGLCFKYVDDDVETAAKLMEEAQVRRLLVMDHDERCVGVLSLGDIAKRAPGPTLAGEILEEVAQPAG